MTSSSKLFTGAIGACVGKVAVQAPLLFVATAGAVSITLPSRSKATCTSTPAVAVPMLPFTTREYGVTTTVGVGVEAEAIDTQPTIDAPPTRSSTASEATSTVLVVSPLRLSRVRPRDTTCVISVHTGRSPSMGLMLT